MYLIFFIIWPSFICHNGGLNRNRLSFWDSQQASAAKSAFFCWIWSNFANERRPKCQKIRSIFFQRDLWMIKHSVRLSFLIICYVSSEFQWCFFWSLEKKLGYLKKKPIIALVLKSSYLCWLNGFLSRTCDGAHKLWNMIPTNWAKNCHPLQNCDCKQSGFLLGIPSYILQRTY